MNTIEARLAQLERDLQNVKRRSRTMASVAMVTAFVALAIGAPRPGSAGQSTDARLDALEAKTDCMEKIGSDVFFGLPGNGCNVHVRSGTGSTNSTVNGTGNLIVGYNETRPEAGDDRSGSHNLIVGKWHNFSGFGGTVLGLKNNIAGGFNNVTGGKENTSTSGSVGATSVTGGKGNVASSGNAAIIGGNNNTATGTESTVTGGRLNSATGNYSTVSGGRANLASGLQSAVSGGDKNTAAHDRSTVSGGANQTTTAAFQHLP